MALPIRIFYFQQATSKIKKEKSFKQQEKKVI